MITSPMTASYRAVGVLLALSLLVACALNPPSTEFGSATAQNRVVMLADSADLEPNAEPLLHSGEALNASVERYHRGEARSPARTGTSDNF